MNNRQTTARILTISTCCNTDAAMTDHHLRPLGTVTVPAAELTAPQRGNRHVKKLLTRRRFIRGVHRSTLLHSGA